MGMLTAVEMWKKRDQTRDRRQCGRLAGRMATERGNAVQMAASRGDRRPEAFVRPSASPGDLSGTARSWALPGRRSLKTLLDTEPPYVLLGSGSGSRPDHMASTVSITPYMMMPGNAKVVAERLFAVMSKPPHFEAEPLPQGAPASVDGQWEATITYLRGSAVHNLVIEQHGDKLVGTHQGETVSGDLRRQLCSQPGTLPQLSKNPGHAAFFRFHRNDERRRHVGRREPGRVWAREVDGAKASVRESRAVLSGL